MAQRAPQIICPGSGRERRVARDREYELAPRGAPVIDFATATGAGGVGWGVWRALVREWQHSSVVAVAARKAIGGRLEADFSSTTTSWCRGSRFAADLGRVRRARLTSA